MTPEYVDDNTGAYLGSEPAHRRTRAQIEAEAGALLDSNDSAAHHNGHIVRANNRRLAELRREWRSAEAGADRAADYCGYCGHGAHAGPCGVEAAAR
jgi:hypothetical protein